MKLIPVDSSNIEAVGYEGNTLHIQFKPSGARYSYANVPADVHKALMESESLGSYFSHFVKGKYETTKLG